VSGDRSLIRVLVADDDETLLDLMFELLRRRPEFMVVARAANGRDAVRLFTESKPDVAVLDWYMPLLNGFDAARKIIALASGARVLMVSGYPQERLVLRALRAGVTGFLTRQAFPTDLVAAVLRVAAGERHFDGRIDPRDMAADLPAGPEKDGLTQREREVFQLVVESHSCRSIASILHITEETVEHHRSSIMKKLELYDLPALTRYAIREGLILA
jgi:DNA-binding NarL/FixJ family response regulator